MQAAVCGSYAPAAQSADVYEVVAGMVLSSSALSYERCGSNKFELQRLIEASTYPEEGQLDRAVVRQVNSSIFLGSFLLLNRIGLCHGS